MLLKGFIAWSINPFCVFLGWISTLVTVEKETAKIYKKSIVFFDNFFIIEYSGIIVPFNYYILCFALEDRVMINTNVFDYINVLDKAADASWMRNEAIANNIANATTPGYKRQDVAFEAELKRALGQDDCKSMDEKVADLKKTSLNPILFKI